MGLRIGAGFRLGLLNEVDESTPRSVYGEHADPVQMMVGAVVLWIAG
jgi:hypothetical protein